MTFEFCHGNYRIMPMKRITSDGIVTVPNCYGVERKSETGSWYVIGEIEYDSKNCDCTFKSIGMRYIKDKIDNNNNIEEVIMAFSKLLEAIGRSERD